MCNDSEMNLLTDTQIKFEKHYMNCNLYFYLFICAKVCGIGHLNVGESLMTNAITLLKS